MNEHKQTKTASGKPELQQGEYVIHANDYAYFEACEAGLKACLKFLKDLDYDNSNEMIAGIDVLFEGADPLRGTEGESFVKSIHSKRESNPFEAR
jgi:hypothetical protein